MTWGITGNHEMTILSTDFVKDAGFSDSTSNYFYRDTGPIPYQLKGDSLFIYAKVKITPRTFDSKIKVIHQELSFRERGILKKEISLAPKEF